MYEIHVFNKICHFNNERGNLNLRDKMLPASIQFKQERSNVPKCLFIQKYDIFKHYNILFKICWQNKNFQSGPFTFFGKTILLYCFVIFAPD